MLLTSIVIVLLVVLGVLAFGGYWRRGANPPRQNQVTALLLVGLGVAAVALITLSLARSN